LPTEQNPLDFFKGVFIIYYELHNLYTLQQLWVKQYFRGIHLSLQLKIIEFGQRISELFITRRSLRIL